MKNIEEAKVGSGTAGADKSSEKRAQISLKMIQLRMKQNKERASLASQKKSLQKEETMNESFSASQIAALKAEYSKINGIDPASDTYKKLIAMLDRLDLKSLQSLAGAEIKFVSKLAQNRVLRKSMKKEEVESIDENEDLANARKMYHKHFVAAMKAMPSSIVQKRHQDEMEKYKKIMGNSFIDQVAPSKFAKFDKKIKEEVQLDELSTNKLADYKKKAGADASAADKAGDTKKGNKRFSGIMKATRKQFDNDAKQKTEELSPKQKALDKNKNGKIDGFDLSHLRKKTEELSPAQKAIDKNKNGKIDGADLAHLRSKKKQPQGADFAAQRRKERLASNGRMDEEVKVGDKVSFNHPMTAAPGKTMKKVGTVHKVEDDAVHVKVKSKYGVITHKKTASELTKEEFNIGEESINEKSDYEVYHKDYSGAVQAAIKQAEKRGYEVDMDDWHDKVATGPKKPSSGKTNSFSVNLMKDGKPSKKKLQMQVYNMDNHKYELNMYIEEIQLDELNKDTLYSYAKKSEKDQDDQFNKIGKGIRDKDPKSANKAGHKFSMRSIGQNRAEKRLAKEAASPAQQAAIAIAMKKAGKKPKDMEESDAYDKNVKPSDKPHDKEAAAKRAKLAALAARKKMTEGLMDKIKAIKRGMQAKDKADDHFDKAGDPKNANASKDLKKAVRYHNLLNKEEVVLEAKKKSWKDMRKKTKNEEVPNKATVKKGDMLTGKKEPIEINPELKEPAK